MQRYIITFKPHILEYEDLKELREAKQKEANVPTVDLKVDKKNIGFSITSKAFRESVNSPLKASVIHVKMGGGSYGVYFL